MLPRNLGQIDVKAKNLDIELGNLKIVTLKESGNNNGILTGKDVDVFIDGVHFSDIPFLKYLNYIDIHIGIEDCQIKYNVLPLK